MVSHRVLTRFLSYVDKSGDCWRWNGARIRTGYGRFFFNGKPRYAHRVAMEIFTEAPPDDLLVMHSCDNPSCVNPAHLSIGSQADNMRDAAAKGRLGHNTSWAGTRNPKAKLSREQSESLIARAVAGERTGLLAREFQVSRIRVQQLRRAAKKNGGGYDVEQF